MTPFAVLSRVVPVEEVTKRRLVVLSRQLEETALRHPPHAVAGTLQDQRHLSERTRDVYASIARAGAPARLHARGLQTWIAPGVTGVDLDDDDPLVDEWVVVVPGPQPAALAAADLGLDAGLDDDRRFSLAVTHDPALVESCGRLLGI